MYDVLYLDKKEINNNGQFYSPAIIDGSNILLRCCWQKSAVLLQFSSLRVSLSCGRATAQNFSDFVQNLEICMRKLKIYAY